MRALIKKGKPAGTVSAPPSKSVLHRMLIAAALSGGTSLITKAALNNDIRATMNCLNALSADCRFENGKITVHGMNGQVTGSELFCDESGSTFRFMVPVALVKCDEAFFTGSHRLMERGIGIYEDVLSKKGIAFEKKEDGILMKGHLIPGTFEIPGNISSQYITGLMFALPLLEKDSVIKIIPPLESRAYIDITVDVLRKYGVEIRKTGEYEYLVPGNQRYSETDSEAEADWSNAAFPIALKKLGFNVEVDNLNRKSLQGDKACEELMDRLLVPGQTVDISENIDLGPVLFAFAAAKNGGTITGVRRLRIKESDRVEAMITELKKFGCEFVISENSVEIKNTGLVKPMDKLFGHNDHRIVMALSVLLLLTGGEMEGAEAVNKSYPDFFKDLVKLGAEVQLEA